MTTRRRVALLLTVTGALAACGGPDPVAEAQERCRAHYDVLWRHVSAHGALPESQEELRAAAQITGPDPWGTPYHVETEGVIRVWSSGPDREADTDDDLCYPPLE